MKTTEIVSESNKKLWISITGYRTILLLIVLLEKGRTIEELVDILKSDKITAKSVSKDTVRITLNTLKSAGCEITRPLKSNGYKYEIISHPFVLNLSKEDMQNLINLRERICVELGWEKVIILNELYDKIIKLTQNPEQIGLIETAKPLFGINSDILKELSSGKLIGKKVNITYFSPKYGLEDIDIIPNEIVYENTKLYLWCYSFKYNQTSILNIERIKKINVIELSPVSPSIDFYEVIYELPSSYSQNFKTESNEEIISQNNNYIQIKARVSNEFWFIQRLLLFGSDFRIITPDFFKEKLIEKIKQIQKVYKI